MSDYDPVASRKRQYKRALLEMQAAIQLEIQSLEEDPIFEPSNGISGIAFNLIKHQAMLSGVIEGIVNH
ncbi:hypothetical protein VF04_04390 [Nostoc linckia z7]|uniref:Uncharacterized protein n=2 Tax=Nostoc linckia TaxID=92942 RepID=A0A9Q6EN43_NOSLI|nr:hypothetical protein [Nostoc linckia]PHK42951.1 hypothetical protein VF12_01090 [Nostoc linckia z15]PHK48108.1 hypothetical protein VF13_02065 [Nostoc linckia z16]PHJ65028.1 hypothetical protein VF02_11875 [Nostoc linckia z1]PHJ70069.1 hypothetical protein VF05_11270 [Nostoc linckia z3]PHJ75107.1 hypothetical protein VF03_12195 [Nostoc linckia z2]